MMCMGSPSGGRKAQCQCRSSSPRPGEGDRQTKRIPSGRTQCIGPYWRRAVAGAEQDEDVLS